MGIKDAANIEQWKEFLKKLKEKTGLKLTSIIRLSFKKHPNDCIFVTKQCRQGDNGRRHDIKNIDELRCVFDQRVEKQGHGNDVITLQLEVLGYDQAHLLSRYQAQQGPKIGILDMSPTEVRKIVVPESWFNLNPKEDEQKAKNNWRYSDHYRQLVALYNYDEDESKALDKRPPVQNVMNVCGVDESAAQDMMRSFERLKCIAYAKDNDTDHNDKQDEEIEKYNQEEKELELDLKNTKQSSRDSVEVEIASIESSLKQVEADTTVTPLKENNDALMKSICQYQQKQQEQVHAYDFEKERQRDLWDTEVSFEQVNFAMIHFHLSIRVLSIQKELACNVDNDNKEKKNETNADKKKEELNTEISNDRPFQSESIPLTTQVNPPSDTFSQSSVQKKDNAKSRNNPNKKQKHKQTDDNGDKTNFNGLIESIDKLANAVNTFNQSANQLNQSVMQWSLCNSQMGMPAATALGYSVCTPYSFQPLQSLQPQPQQQSQQPPQPLSYFQLSCGNQQTRPTSTPQFQAHTPFLSVKVDLQPFNNPMYPQYLQQMLQSQQQQRQQIATAMQQMQQSLIQNSTDTTASPVIASIPSFNAPKIKTDNKNSNETNVGSLFNYPDFRASLPVQSTSILSNGNDQNNVNSERLRRGRNITTTLPPTQTTLDQIYKS
ncbi:hypothetical protein RFI_01131 [Reticulomyxa filosa]|uniref:Uncharacterized protein n=1 Tax=Reticulomyxa filosa TaxID=46433 RepID=X6PBQ3_RETFI|nr:hypothetical protein RFI_01131 [Reticulomyxa filosa]|eukprot:ETO35925.1 hypothetical protein RFI_01131 [Reticulomyxa filosa]